FEVTPERSGTQDGVAGDPELLPEDVTAPRVFFRRRPEQLRNISGRGQESLHRIPDAIRCPHGDGWTSTRQRRVLREQRGGQVADRDQRERALALDFRVQHSANVIFHVVDFLGTAGPPPPTPPPTRGGGTAAPG